MSTPPDFGDDILVRTRLLAPRLPRRWLARERLHRTLSAVVEYPLTIVQASAGYGKSAALASFASLSPNPVAWLNVEGCEDPVVFMVHLVHACRSFSPGAGAHSLEMLQHGGSQAWAQSLDSLINDVVDVVTGDVVLILDDYHTVGDLAEIRALVERLITLRPPQLHLLLAARRQPLLASLPALRARGELLEIGEQELSFTPNEIGLLFTAAYGYDLAPAEAQALGKQTGGWPIALQLIWQNLQNGPGGDAERSDAPEGSRLPPHARALKDWGREALFAYLAREVLARQPAGVQDFLLRTSVLAELRPAACDYILGVANSAQQLEALYGQGLFLTAIGGGAYRYHPLFHEFLQERAAELPRWKELHLHAADYYRSEGAGEQVLYHLIAVGDMAAAAEELERLAQNWLEDGRLVTLLSWIDHLPAETVGKHPQLLIARGDAARLLARFDTAHQSYAQAGSIYQTQEDRAGQAWALRGQAMIYAGTMQPRRAEVELRRALKLLPAGHAARAELLGLIVESWVARGRPARALRLADLVSPANAGTQISRENRAKALVRLGRLAEARAALQESVPDGQEMGPGEAPSKAQCEAALLLSLILALEGEREGL
jgi:LuxR family transcriptional regulator, maltose regulon positive regulatory protein